MKLGDSLAGRLQDKKLFKPDTHAAVQTGSSRTGDQSTGGLASVFNVTLLENTQPITNDYLLKSALNRIFDTITQKAKNIRTADTVAIEFKDGDQEPQLSEKPFALSREQGGRIGFSEQGETSRALILDDKLNDEIYSKVVDLVWRYDPCLKGYNPQQEPSNEFARLLADNRYSVELRLENNKTFVISVSV